METPEHAHDRLHAAHLPRAVAARMRGRARGGGISKNPFVVRVICEGRRGEGAMVLKDLNILNNFGSKLVAPSVRSEVRSHLSAGRGDSGCYVRKTNGKRGWGGPPTRAGHLVVACRDSVREEDDVWT